ncbi:MAG: hypothetical protein IJK46_03730 [Prevotella sp.]|nr:hypothetical protein [Prevotella sp.]
MPLASFLDYSPILTNKLRPPIAEQQDGFFIRADGTGGERNERREDYDSSPLASTGLTAFCASSV